jgi:hypothetical protein
LDLLVAFLVRLLDLFGSSVAFHWRPVLSNRLLQLDDNLRGFQKENRSDNNKIRRQVVYC